MSATAQKLIGNKTLPVRTFQPFPRFLRPLGKWIRQGGQYLDYFGVKLQGANAYVETLVPSTRVVPVSADPKEPHKMIRIHGVLAAKDVNEEEKVFIASSASIVGDNISIAASSSVWYGALVRGDRQGISIGRSTSVLEHAMVTTQADKPMTVIGDDVVISPSAYLCSCTVEDGAMIGMGARIMPGAHIGKDAFVDAGAVVPEGTRVESGQLWTGNPAQHLRNLSVDEMSYLRSMSLSYSQLSQRHRQQQNKTVDEIEYDEFLQEWREWMAMAPEEPLPEVDPAMVQYYTLARAQPTQIDQGLFRQQEYDDHELVQRKIAEEQEADKQEEAYYSTLVSLERVYDTVKRLSDTRPDRHHERERILGDLEGRDEQATDFMYDFLQRAKEAASDPGKEEELLKDLRELDPSRDPRIRGMFAEEQLDALKEHAQHAQLDRSSSSGNSRKEQVAE